MGTLPRLLRRFFFVPEKDSWLSLLRIGIGAAVLVDCVSLRRDWYDLLSLRGFGIVKRDLAEAILAGASPWIPKVGWLVGIGDYFGLNERTTLDIIWWGLLAASLLLVLGLASRSAAMTTAFLHLCVVKSIGSMTYGFDNFATIALFYVAVGPLPDRLSLDCFLRKRPLKDPHLSGLFRNVLRIHLCLAYFFGGLAKAAGAGWWNGENLWRAMIRPPFNVIPEQMLVHWRALFPFAAISVTLLELSYPVFIWPRRTRPYWLSAVVVMHAGIGLLLGLHLFALVMIILNLAAFASFGAAPQKSPGQLLSTGQVESETIG